MVTRVNLNIPPPLVERARVAQLANRQALDEKQKRSRVKKKVIEQVKLRQASVDPRKIKGGLLDHGSTAQWKIRTKKRKLISAWLLVPDADYTGQNLQARPYDGTYEAISPVGKKFSFVDASLEARNTVPLDSTDPGVPDEGRPFSSKNLSRLDVKINDVINESRYTFEFMVRLGSSPFSLSELPLQPVCDTIDTSIYNIIFNSFNPDTPPAGTFAGSRVLDGTYTQQRPFGLAQTANSYFELVSSIGIFRARISATSVILPIANPSDASPQSWELDFGNGFTQYPGIANGSRYHVAISCAIESGTLVRRTYFNGNLVAVFDGSIIEEKLEFSVKSQNYRLKVFTPPTPIQSNSGCPALYEVFRMSGFLNPQPEFIGYGLGAPVLQHELVEVFIAEPSNDGVSAVSEMRFTVGSALYTENTFTPPTSISSLE